MNEVVIQSNTYYMPNGSIMPELLTEDEAILFLRLDKVSSTTFFCNSVFLF
jgi:hypothetical protein